MVTAMTDQLLFQNEHSPVDEKLNKILTIVRKHLGMSVAFVSEFTNGKRVFTHINAERPELAPKPGDHDPQEDTYCYKLCHKQVPELIPDTSKNQITNALDVTSALQIGCYIGVPIYFSSGRLYGTFCSYKEQPDETYTDKDIALLQMVSEIVASILEKDAEAQADNLKVCAELANIITNQKLTILYQPIYCLHSNEVSGYESLSRFHSDPYRPPNEWFDDAEKVGWGEALEIMAIKKAVQGVSLLNTTAYVSINVSPEYILNGALSRALEHIDASRIVVEITEHSPVDDYEAFKKALQPLRKQGLRLAVDDAGAGYASFQHILQIEPDYIKLDVSLTRDIHKDTKKQLLAKALFAYAKAIDCTIIAEGIEILDELSTLRELGIDKIQGYFLSHPLPINEANQFSVELASVN